MLSAADTYIVYPQMKDRVNNYKSRAHGSECYV
jgi:hypothetical protein